MCAGEDRLCVFAVDVRRCVCGEGDVLVAVVDCGEGDDDGDEEDERLR